MLCPLATKGFGGQLIRVKISSPQVRSTFLSGVDPLMSYSIILLSDAVEPIMLVSTGLNFKLCTLSTPHVNDLQEKRNTFFVFF